MDTRKPLHRRDLLSLQESVSHAVRDQLLMLSSSPRVNTSTNSLYRTALGSMSYAVIVADAGGHLIFMNPAAEKLTGWLQNEVLRKPLTDVFNIVDERSSRRVEDSVSRAIREGTVTVSADHTALIARDGSKLPIEDSASPILRGGRVVGGVLVFHDISSRREMEHHLEISEVRYRRLFESAHDGILILDALTTKVLDVNPFMTELLGYPRGFFLGKELWEIGVFKDAEASKRAMTTLQSLGHIRYEDLPLQHQAGRHIPVEFVSNVYQEGDEKVIQCNIRDITQRKELADDLAKARWAAEAASRSKSEFLANMSHEIRTPMGAILGFSEMLLLKSPEECAKIGCVQIIQRNATHLLELINEILDLSKIEAGQMKVERVSCDLPELLSDVASLMGPRAVEKGLKFGVSIEGALPHLILTDPLRLRQILVNLLGNAVKFTDSGKIDIRVRLEDAVKTNLTLHIDVIDTGIGVTSEQFERLFLPFTQADTSVTRKFKGTGLGLSISRQLARLLDGDITATSQPGVGSTFTLKIDGGPSAGVELLEGLTEATLPAPVDHSIPSKIHLRGRILLAEDGADNQRLLRMQLSDAGATVTSALDGQIAIDLATRERFDLILMDMQMPVMDGYAATIELRRRGVTIPIIALTAHAMAEDREKCLASGCSDYLSKPIKEDTLLTNVQKNLEKNPSPISEDVSTETTESMPLAVTAEGSQTIKSSFASDQRIMQIVPEFVAGLRQKVLDMAEFVKVDDRAALQLVVHQLRGACGGYGFDEIYEPAARVEQSLQSGKDLKSIANELESLFRVIRRIDGYEMNKSAKAKASGVQN
jgi:PAS domain S-box-containing protein